MKISEILTPSFRSLREQLGFSKERKPMVESCQASDSDFCRETMDRGWLTEEQMAHASERYRLGKSKSGRCIFWMIDELGQVRDGHLGDTWVSVMLKAREPELLRDWSVSHCLFGLHLLLAEEEPQEGIDCRTTMTPVCVVEKERSAVILSELFPNNIWLATVYPMNFSVFSFEPLCGHSVTLFPPTDETMDSYLYWMEVADQARRQYKLHISVSDVLELHATPEQKRRKTDLVDFLFEASKDGV